MPLGPLDATAPVKTPVRPAPAKVLREALARDRRIIARLLDLAATVSPYDPHHLGGLAPKKD